MSAFVGVIVGLLQGLLSIFGLAQPSPAPAQLPPDMVINPAQQTITGATNTISQQQTTKVYGSVRFTTAQTSDVTQPVLFMAALPGGIKDKWDYVVYFGDRSSPQEMTWDNGKGTPDAWSLSISHIYASSGTYTATLSYGTCFPEKDCDLKEIGTTKVNVASAPLSDIPVSDMSKYTDADFGFSFWYPSGWTISRSADTKTVQFTPSRKANDAPTGGGISVQVNSNNATFDGLFQQARQVPYYNHFNTITVGGEQAFSYETSEFAGTVAVVIHSGYIFTLSNEIVTNPKILSSFKFIQ